MDGVSSEAMHRAEPADGDGTAPGDLGRALDQLTTASDDERVRRVIDALIHPTPAASGGGAALPAADVPAPAAGTPARPAPAPDGLGLCRADTWHRLLEVEHACAARYRARTTIIQLEIADIDAAEAVLGEAAAARLIRLLADTVRADTRPSDTFTRISRWRIAGLLPYTEGRAADAVIGRIAEGFGRRLGGLPIQLLAGRAEVDPKFEPDASLTRAEGAMTARARRGAEAGRRGDRADAAPETAPDAARDPRPVAVMAQAGPDRRDGESRRHTDTPVPDSLAELERLRVADLISDEEYRRTRRRILRRL